MFVFLRHVRATLIPSVTIPVSLLSTCAIMYLFNYTIDNVSLMALTIAVGFIIDDAVVMVENIIRHIEDGKRPLEAALVGSREVGFTILSMTMSLISVFIPLLLMGGLIGRLFREFAVTVSVAILMSGVISLTLTPMMCGWLLRPQQEDEREWRIMGYLEAAYQRSLAAYTVSLRWSLRHRMFMLGLMAATMAATVFLYDAIPKGSFRNRTTASFWAPPKPARTSPTPTWWSACTRWPRSWAGTPTCRPSGTGSAPIRPSIPAASRSSSSLSTSARRPPPRSWPACARRPKGFRASRSSARRVRTCRSARA